MTIIQKSIMKFTPNEQLFGYKTDNQMLVWMKPSEFLEKTPKIIFQKLTAVNNLAEKMKKDIPIDPLFLDIDIVNCKVINHEGRHRAMAAEKAGISKVPVIIYLKDDQGDFISVKEYMKQVTTANVMKCNYFDAQKQK